MTPHRSLAGLVLIALAAVSWGTTGATTLLLLGAVGLLTLRCRTARD